MPPWADLPVPPGVAVFRLLRLDARPDLSPSVARNHLTKDGLVSKHHPVDEGCPLCLVPDRRGVLDDLYTVHAREGAADVGGCGLRTRCDGILNYPPTNFGFAKFIINLNSSTAAWKSEWRCSVIIAPSLASSSAAASCPGAGGENRPRSSTAR